MRSLAVELALAYPRRALTRWRRGRSAVFGYFAAFCLAVSMSLRDQPVTAAFSLALPCALVVQLAVRRFFTSGTKIAAARG